MSRAGLSHARATGSLDERDGPPTPADPMAWPSGAWSPRRGGDSGAGGRGSRRIDAASSPRDRRAAPRLRDLSGPGTTESQSDSVTPGPVSPGLGPVGLPDKVRAARGRLRPRPVCHGVCAGGGCEAGGLPPVGWKGRRGGELREGRADVNTVWSSEVY